MQTEPYDVVIVGAGLAGLAAAAWLSSQGKRVVVLEAQEKSGGRCVSASFPSTHPSVSVEVPMGVACLHELPESTARDLQRVGTTARQNGQDKRCQAAGSCMFLNEKKASAKLGVSALILWRNAVENAWKFVQAEDSTDHTERAVKRQAVEVHHQTQAALSAAGATLANKKSVYAILEHFRRQEYIKTEEDSLVNWYKASSTLYCGASLRKVSKRVLTKNSLFRSALPDYHRNMYELDGLVKFLDNQVVVKYSCAVSKISVLTSATPESGTKAHTNTRVRIETQTGEVYIASKCLCTVSVGVLKSKQITFEPELPSSKQASLENFRMGCANKISFLLDDSPLDYERHSTFMNVLAESEEFENNPLYFHARTLRCGKLLFVAYCNDVLSKMVEGLDDDECRDLVLKSLTNMIGRFVTPQRVSSQVLVSRWAANPYTLGSHVYPALDCTEEDFAHLRDPAHGAIYFAGDAYSTTHFGTALGALSSAAQMCYGMYPTVAGADARGQSSSGASPSASACASASSDPHTDTASHSLDEDAILRNGDRILTDMLLSWFQPSAHSAPQP